ncbi:CheW domain-containing protein [Pseudomonas sp. RIT-PI-S]|uniref:CheW domain-containing protein n=1 Tax=Pseudomonas sp. RIT-PI-S TaxID=3035295 RepID=UPI0021D84A7B|nr:CheW domain-containing protein [Pseudomonas sp. RIT-PI-S]
MSRPVDIPRRPRQALQSYLDGLLQEATEDWAVEPASVTDIAPPAVAPVPVTPVVALAPVLAAVPIEPEPALIDEFEAAVLEEQVRDARLHHPMPKAEPRRALAQPLVENEPAARFEEPSLWIGPSLLPQVSPQILEEALAPEHAPLPVAMPVPVAPVAEAAPATPMIAEPMESTPVAALQPNLTGQPGGPATPVEEGVPAWAGEPFECLLFDVAGLTLAVPLVCLGSIYPLAGQELTPLFGQPEWFLGLLPSHSGNLKVLDTARWVMPDRYRDDFQQGLQYVISVQGYEWGLAVHSVSRSLRLDPAEIKWRVQRGQRPWLAGTVIEHMCALLDVAQLAEMIASGAVKRQEAEARAKAAADAKAQAAAARGRKR